MIAKNAVRYVVQLFLVVACVPVSTGLGVAPNILVIMIDDIGYGDLGCYGNTIHDTPHIDRLAAGGMRFTDFHSNGAVCSPTRAAFLTGQYQQRSGIESAIGFTMDEGLALSRTTLAEALSSAGYDCGVFGKWHVGHVGRFGPNDQGFRLSFVSNNSADYHSHISRVGELDWFKDHQPFEEEGYLTDLISHHALRFIESERQGPFFAFVSHVACHFPFQGPTDPPHRTAGQVWHDSKYGPLPEAEYKRAYKDMIESVDRSVGAMIESLERRGLRDRTLVFVTSDNGAYSWVGSNGVLRGQKGDVFEGGHRVPAIANWPGKISPGSVCDQLAATMDLMPTILSLANVTTSQEITFDGIDLTKALIGGQALSERKLFWRVPSLPPSLALRDGRWKYIEHQGEKLLFDLAQDASEAHDLSEVFPARLSHYQQALQAWQASVSGAAASGQ